MTTTSQRPNIVLILADDMGYSDADQPFFMYVAYTAPYWPLHAFEEDIARYQGQYRKGGWDAARTARHEVLKDMEVVNSRWDISPRDEDAPPWHDVLPWPINSGAWRFPGMNREGTFYMRGRHGHMV